MHPTTTEVTSLMGVEGSATWEYFAPMRDSLALLLGDLRHFVGPLELEE